MTEDVFEDPEALRRLTAYDRDGEWIGAVDDVFVDNLRHRPEWATVRTYVDGVREGDTLVPLVGATHTREGILDLACTVADVRSAPRVEPEQHLDLVQEQELYVHYGLAGPQEASGAPGVGGGRPPLPVAEDGHDLQDVKELADAPPTAPPVPRLRRYVPGEIGREG
ncbi:hypothetical protein [Streptomyces sp. NPDC049040]|uniref:hypothetical protein n=1 Tax=Streptomyces sp. NPDC049040 TaxID=3365593 RepID=UPI0037190918